MLLGSRSEFSLLFHGERHFFRCHRVNDKIRKRGTLSLALFHTRIHFSFFFSFLSIRILMIWFSPLDTTSQIPVTLDLRFLPRFTMYSWRRRLRLPKSDVDA